MNCMRNEIMYSKTMKLLIKIPPEKGSLDQITHENWYFTFKNDMLSTNTELKRKIFVFFPIQNP